MISIIIKAMYPLCCSQTKILIDQLDKRPIYWIKVANAGTFTVYEAIVVFLKIREVNIEGTKRALLSALLKNKTSLLGDE